MRDNIEYYTLEYLVVESIGQVRIGEKGGNEEREANLSL